MLNRIGWQQGHVRCTSRGVSSNFCGAISYSYQFAAANQCATKPGSVWNQKLTMKAKMKKRICCYWCYIKILEKVVGM